MLYKWQVAIDYQHLFMGLGPFGFVSFILI